MTKEEAVELYDSGCWASMSNKDIVEFQLFEERLCMPFIVFCRAVESVLGRPVTDIEFAYPEHLRKEYQHKETI